MEKLLLSLGGLAGIGGTLLCALAVGMRLAGRHWAAGFETLTLLQGGMAAMIFACLCYLVVLVQRR